MKLHPLLARLWAQGLTLQRFQVRGAEPIQFWCLPLELEDDLIVDLQGLLSEDEQVRATQCRLAPVRQRYQIVRGSLRLLLAQTLACAPDSLQFNYNAKGKPALDPKINSAGVTFNLSHSHNLAIIGITRQAVIGVDLEYLRPLPRLESLARRFFAPEEYHALIQSPLPRRNPYFFELWTAKEAYLKATGAGVAGGLAKVILAPDRQSYRSLPDQSRSWQLISFPLYQDYWAAIAVGRSRETRD